MKIWLWFWSMYLTLGFVDICVMIFRIMQGHYEKFPRWTRWVAGGVTYLVYTGRMDKKDVHDL